MITAGSALKDMIQLCYAANRPLLLKGRHGVGKSDILAQAAQEMGIGFICRDLSIMEPTDLVGLPKHEGGRTVYAPPAFLPREDEPSKGKGLLVFEELNRCERYMRAPCLQLLTARTLNDYALPAGWLPMAAVNPDDDDYETDALDPALRSRFVEVRVVADKQAWLGWARTNGIHEAVIRYVEQQEEVFEDPASNPRSWRYVSDVLHAADKVRDTSRATLRRAICGTVGDVHGSAFVASLNAVDQPLSAEQVLAAYGRHRSRVRRWVDQGHVDLVKVTLHAVLVRLQPENEYERIRESEVAWANLGLFIHDLPGDLRERAHRTFEARGYELPAAPSHTPEGVGA